MFLNSYGLTPEGTASLYEIDGGLAHRTRDELRELAGTEVWTVGTDAYSYEEPRGLAFSAVKRAISTEDNISTFVLREALIQHARSLGLEAWTGRSREIEIRGLTTAVTEDVFEIEQVLTVRVTSEFYVDTPFLLTARPKARWRSALPLSDATVASHAVGESAIQSSGDGPRRGRIVALNGSTATLLVAGKELEVNADDYKLAVNAGLVSRWRGPSVLSHLRVAGGEYTSEHRRNQHAVADRFKFMGDSVRRLGDRVPVNGGGSITIGPPVRLRVQVRQ